MFMSSICFGKIDVSVYYHPVKTIYVTSKTIIIIL